MHEYSIVDALIQRVADEAARANAVTVHRLHVRIGELAGVETELLRIAYETFREGTVCAGAELALTPVVAQWQCPSCGRGIARGARLQCPECALPARLAQGDEIILDQIELEVA